ncbi:MAG: hypothetical protein IT317_11985 [Anaerolineales bacterium]|nr:hypothetical protein [Anaerolineales bacterium]
MTALALELNPQYITDAGGNRVGVILAMDVYRKVVEALEDLVDQADFDEAMAAKAETMPFEQAIAEIERDRPAA